MQTKVPSLLLATLLSATSAYPAVAQEAAPAPEGSSGSPSSLEAVREQQALLNRQGDDLRKQADLSGDGLKEAEASLVKQQAVLSAGTKRLEDINQKVVKLKRQRGQAMAAAYLGGGKVEIFYALVSSQSLSEFVRRSQYTLFLLDQKSKRVADLDGELEKLDRERRDLVTKRNAYELEIFGLQKRAAEIRAALAANKGDLDAARKLEEQLLSATGINTQGGCRNFGAEASGETFTIVGSGTEHGLGMSQYGAKGFANEGRNYRQILSHYYQGTSLKSVGSFSTNQGESDGYLVGVVEAEMNSNWPMEALKAQAVAARSYAYINRGSLDNTPRTQAWVGPSRQTDRARQAVRETAGQVNSFNGEVVASYFHSTSGGCTENNENAWGGTPLPWLRGVSSPGETDSPHWNWRSKTYSRGEMSAILGKDARTAVGDVRAIRIIGRGVSGRATVVQIVGSSGVKTVSGPRFKAIFNVNSPDADPLLKNTLFGFG